MMLLDVKYIGMHRKGNATFFENLNTMVVSVFPEKLAFAIVHVCFLVFFLPAFPVLFRFTVFGDFSPFTAVPFEPFAVFFLTKSFDLFCRCKLPSLPFALKCCCTISLKAPS